MYFSLRKEFVKLKENVKNDPYTSCISGGLRATILINRGNLVKVRRNIVRTVLLI